MKEKIFLLKLQENYVIQKFGTDTESSRRLIIRGDMFNEREFEMDNEEALNFDFINDFMMVLI
jgi:hypothetical protein